MENVIKEWLIPGSTGVTLLTIAVGVWRSLREYRLKLQAETRLKYSSQTEIDIQLLKLFIEIMNIAHARSGTHVSEKAIEMILTPEVLKKFSGNEKLLNNFLDNAVIVLPVGLAAQNAAIAAIGVLGQRHEILRPVAIQALESLMSFKGEIAKKYLDDLKKVLPPPRK